ncbi:MAG: hypothetical protein ACYC1Q_01990, partial [Bacteroidia bacterium]
MSKQEETLKKIISHCKEYGFVFQSSEIYDGLSAVYDYGHNGTELRKNIREYWWKAMVQIHDNIVGIDSAIFMHPKVWKASGHVDGFNDPMIDNKDSKKRYRADQLLEDQISKLEKVAFSEVTRNNHSILVYDSNHFNEDVNYLVKEISTRILSEYDKLSIINLFQFGALNEATLFEGWSNLLKNSINNSEKQGNYLFPFAELRETTRLYRLVNLMLEFNLAMELNELTWLKQLIEE